MNNAKVCIERYIPCALSKKKRKIVQLERFYMYGNYKSKGV